MNHPHFFVDRQIQVFPGHEVMHRTVSIKSHHVPFRRHSAARLVWHQPDGLAVRQFYVVSRYQPIRVLPGQKQKTLVRREHAEDQGDAVPKQQRTVETYGTRHGKRKITACRGYTCKSKSECTSTIRWERVFLATASSCLQRSEFWMNFR